MRKESNYGIMKHQMQDVFAQGNLALAAEKWHLDINDEVIYVRFIARDYTINVKSGLILRADNGIEADYNEAMTLYDILSREPAVTFEKFVSIDFFSGLKSTSVGSSIFDSAKAAFDHQETKLARACEKLGDVPFGKSDVGLFGGLCGSLNNIFVHMSGQNIGNDMRKDCFRKIMRFSFPQMNYFGSGSLVTRVTNDITQVQNFVSQFVGGMIRTMMLTFGSIFCMWRLNSRFGLIVLCAFPFLVGTLIICLCKANPLLLQLQGKLDDINAIMQEDISGIRIIKACVREIYEKARFGKANDELIKTQLQTLVIFAFMNPIVNAIMYILRYHTQ